MNGRPPLFKSTPQTTFVKIITFRWVGRVGLIANGFSIGMGILGLMLVVETHPSGLGRYLRGAFGEAFDPAWYGYVLIAFALATIGRRFRGVELYLTIAPLVVYEGLAMYFTLRYPSVERISIALVPWLLLSLFTLFYVLEQTDAHFVRPDKSTDTDT